DVDEVRALGGRAGRGRRQGDRRRGRGHVHRDDLREVGGERVGVGGGADVDVLAGAGARGQPATPDGAVAVQGALGRLGDERDGGAGAAGAERGDDAVAVGDDLAADLVAGVLDGALDLEVLGADGGLHVR